MVMVGKLKVFDLVEKTTADWKTIENLFAGFGQVDENYMVKREESIIEMCQIKTVCQGGIGVGWDCHRHTLC